MKCVPNRHEGLWSPDPGEICARDHPRVFRHARTNLRAHRPVCLFRRTWDGVVPEVTPEADEEQPPPVLRHAEVGGIEKEVADVVAYVVGFSSDLSCEVVPEVLSHPRHVLHHEGKWLCFADGSEEVLVQQVSSGIADATLTDARIFSEEARLLSPSDSGEALAWWTSDHDVRTVAQSVEEIRDRHPVDIPCLGTAEDGGGVSLERVCERVCGGLVKLDRAYTFSTSRLEAERHTAGAGEEIENSGLHG